MMNENLQEISNSYTMAEGIMEYYHSEPESEKLRELYIPKSGGYHDTYSFCCCFNMVTISTVSNLICDDMKSPAACCRPLVAMIIYFIHVFLFSF